MNDINSADGKKNREPSKSKDNNNINLKETKVLSEHYEKFEYRDLDGYKKWGGYTTLPKAFQMKPQEITDWVKKAGLRGRGGAGFSTGTKWGFLPQDLTAPRYLLCNADEGEPGTFKDRMMMERAPHQLIEGMIISAYAISSHKGYIYIRGEYNTSIRSIEKALGEAYKAGLLGKNILNSGFDFDLDFYRGGGAYICGEETAMISSLEGKKGQPKLKPPFPALKGYLEKPTVVNNVETLASVVTIVRDGVEGFRRYGTEKSPGTKIFSLSGNIQRPGNYEVTLGYPLKNLIYELGGGFKPGRKLKAVIPGGSSAPVLTAAEAERVNLDYESLSQAGSMLGSGAVIVIDDSQCMVDLLSVLTHFYHHESCGQCTPCREGTGWLHKVIHSMATGRGRLQDIDLLQKISENMMSKTICALSEAAALPVISFVQKFRDEFEHYVREGRSKVREVRYGQH